MPGMRMTLATPTRKALERLLRRAEQRGDLRTVKRITAMFAVAEGYGYAQIAALLQVSDESIRLWVKAFV